MPKFCGKCGTPLDEETGLCPKCDAEKLMALQKEKEKQVVYKKKFCTRCGGVLDDNGLCPNCDKDKIAALNQDSEEKVVVNKQRFCNKCGSSLDEETGLCPKCDSKKLKKLKDRVEDDQDENEEEPKKKHNVLKIIGMVIGSLAIIAIIAIAVFFLLNNVLNKDTTEESNTDEVVEETEEDFAINTYDYTLEVGEYADIDMVEHGGYTVKSNDFDVVSIVNEQLYGVGVGETTVTITYQSQEYTLNVTVVDSSVDATQTISMKSYNASSTLANQGNTNYNVSNLFDEDSSTCWCEGANEYGIGESITITFNETTELVNFVLSNGYQKSSDTYSNNGRVKVLEFTFDDGTETITIDDSKSAVEYTFSDSHITDSVVITIKDVYEGSKYEDTCISELQFNVLA